MTNAFFYYRCEGKKHQIQEYLRLSQKHCPQRLSILPQTTTIVAAPAILQIFAYCRDNYEPPQEVFDRL